MVQLQFRKIIVNFKDIYSQDYLLESFYLENLLHSPNHTMTSDENKALYIDFCTRHPTLERDTQKFKTELMKDPYFNCLQIKFGYAITCHKSQGSEWNNVYVQCSNTMPTLSSEYFRWLYTAMTRANKCLYLIDPPNIRIYNKIKVLKTPFF